MRGAAGVVLLWAALNAALALTLLLWWSDPLANALFWAAVAATLLLAALEGIAGLWLSVQTDAPPGATIAVIAGAAFAISALARAIR